MKATYQIMKQFRRNLLNPFGGTLPCYVVGIFPKLSP